MVCQYNLRK
uniref:Uncharacterized protein n=1 Tax=Anguilla anguilla TaxID=7936 RepID=A0A0E9XZQ8_ANGAN